MDQGKDISLGGIGVPEPCPGPEKDLKETAGQRQMYQGGVFPGVWWDDLFRPRPRGALPLSVRDGRPGPGVRGPRFEGRGVSGELEWDPVKRRSPGRQRTYWRTPTRASGALAPQTQGSWVVVRLRTQESLRNNPSSSGPGPSGYRSYRLQAPVTEVAPVGDGRTDPRTPTPPVPPGGLRVS